MTTKTKILNHFKKIDKIMYKAAKQTNIELLTPRKPNQYFQSLCFEIIGQQLATKVAKIIFQRFQNLYPNKKITPQATINITEKQIRNIGASWSKAGFIKDLANKVVNGELDFKKLKKLDNQQVIEKLMQVKGIGPWTSEMFLMFTLGREDVFSHGDLGLRKTITKLYSLGENVSKEQIEKITNKWSPYRTYASRVLWESYDV